MYQTSTSRDSALSAIMIAPDGALAAQFSMALVELQAFEILLHLKSYPTGQTLDMRLRQLRPEVLLVDVGSNLEAALVLIEHVCAADDAPTIVALDRNGNSDAIIRVLRAGASEFLYAPFDVANASEAITRLLRLRKTEPVAGREPGVVYAFSSVKPGSGASTLAVQTALALKQIVPGRVLLADFDLTGGSVSFLLKLNHQASTRHVLDTTDGLNHGQWESSIIDAGGIDVLPSTVQPVTTAIDPAQTQSVIDFARTMYDFVVIDLPPVLQRTSLVAISQVDRTYLVSTSELASLHLARRSVNILDQLGFPKENFEVVLNRVRKNDDLGKSDVEKLFSCRVQTTFPNDHFSLHRVVTLGESLAAEGELGKAVKNFAKEIAGKAGELRVTAQATQ